MGGEGGGGEEVRCHRRHGCGWMDSDEERGDGERKLGVGEDQPPSHGQWMAAVMEPLDWAVLAGAERQSRREGRRRQG